MISNMTYKNFKERRFDDVKNCRHEAALTTIAQKYDFSQHVMHLSSPTLEFCEDFLNNFEKYDIVLKEIVTSSYYKSWKVIHPTQENSLSFEVRTTMNISFSDLELGWFSISPPTWMNHHEHSELRFVIALVVEKLKEKEMQAQKIQKELSRQDAINVLNKWSKNETN